MMHDEKCVRINHEVFERVLSEVEKDAFITKKTNVVLGRFSKNNKRFKDDTGAFDSALIGYVRGNDIYIKSSLLSHYSQARSY